MMQNPAVEVTESVGELVDLSNQIGPFAIRGILLLLVALFVSKYLGKWLGALLIKLGVPERRALLPVTALHMFVLLIAALVGLNMMGFPALNIFRFIFATSLLLLAVYIICKPFIPGLPFKEGDHISQGPFSGNVKRTTFTHTIIRTFDGNTAFVPNHKLLNDPLTNFSAHPQRRADVSFFVPYEADVDAVREVVGGVLSRHERVLEDPAPVVVVSEMEPSYREMLARFWLSSGGYIGARWAVLEAIDRALGERGIQRGVPRIEVVGDLADRPTSRSTD